MKGVRTAIKTNVNDYNALRIELRNAPDHIFGNHEKCSDSFCKKKNLIDTDFTKAMDVGFYTEIRKILEPMINKADRLSHNQTTNQAERYMALVAKCTGGKRVDYTKSSSYTARAYAAAISHSIGPNWHLHAWNGRNVGNFRATVFKRRENKHLKRKNQTPTTSFRAKKRLVSGPDIHYGHDAAVVDISNEEMQQKQKEFLQRLEQKCEI